MHDTIAADGIATLDFPGSLSVMLGLLQEGIAGRTFFTVTAVQQQCRLPAL